MTIRRAVVVVAYSALAIAQPLSASPPQAIVSLQVPPPTTSGAWGPLALIVLDRDRALPTGGWTCGELPLDPDEICLGASIVEGDGQIVRYLSAPTVGWVREGPRQRFRFIGGHAVRWVDSQRSMAIVEQTSSGYRWVVWSAPIVRGRACFSQAVVDRFHITPTQPFIRHGDEANCIRVR